APRLDRQWRVEGEGPLAGEVGRGIDLAADAWTGGSGGQQRGQDQQEGDAWMAEVANEVSHGMPPSSGGEDRVPEHPLGGWGTAGSGRSSPPAPGRAAGRSHACRSAAILRGKRRGRPKPPPSPHDERWCSELLRVAEVDGAAVGVVEVE